MHGLGYGSGKKSEQSAFPRQGPSGPEMAQNQAAAALKQQSKANMNQSIHWLAI